MIVQHVHCPDLAKAVDDVARWIYAGLRGERETLNHPAWPEVEKLLNKCTGHEKARLHDKASQADAPDYMRVAPILEKLEGALMVDRHFPHVEAPRLQTGIDGWPGAVRDPILRAVKSILAANKERM